MPGFPTLLEHLSRAYREKHDDVVRNAEGWASQLQKTAGVPASGGVGPTASVENRTRNSIASIEVMPRRRPRAPADDPRRAGGAHVQGGLVIRNMNASGE